MKTHNSPVIPQRSPRLLRLFALAVAVLLATAACSGAGDESVATSVSGDEPAQTTTAPTTNDAMADDDAMSDDAMSDDSHEGDYVDLALDFTGLETLGDCCGLRRLGHRRRCLPVTTGRFNIDADGNAVAEDGETATSFRSRPTGTRRPWSSPSSQPSTLTPHLPPPTCSRATSSTALLS